MSAPRTIAGRFEIGDPERDLLGRGGMGFVYRATDSQTGLPVAVKVLKPDVVASDPDLVARFVREGEALRQLDHPNIVKMIAAVEEGDQHYLILEYVEGGDLRELINERGALPIRQALEIGLEVADALTRAHHLHIVHRDLKPANVLLAQDGTPRLTDFGLARVVGAPHLTQADVVMGTLDYLSPEACRGQELDSRADIWAFGVLLFEMLTGRQPFAGGTAAATLLAILSEPVPDVAQVCQIPDSVADLVYRMLEKDPLQRIPSARLVGAELEALLQEREPASATPTSRPVVSFQPSRFATPTPQAGGHHHNLPAQVTPFVGREAELAELARLVDDPGVRLVTILGHGGMGKTRLALEAGAAQLDGFEHGGYFVSLAPLQSAEAIVPTVAEAIEFSFYAVGGGAAPDPRKQLLDYLRQKQMLLILDNYEHLLDGVDVATDILEAAPGVKILATSRVRLNVQGEYLFHLAGMDFPDWETSEDALEYSAVKLFLQSARRVRPTFELEADDLRYVSRICRLVGGVPLGILLAAAWIEMLSPQEIAAEINRSLDFLETDLRDVPERQRSVRAVFDTSWNTLSGREQEMFQALSVFCGGFARQAAQEVAGASLRELRTLVDGSLLHRAPTGRYDMHELLRQYAWEKLDRSPEMAAAVRDRHAACYTTALQKWETGLKSSHQKATMEEIKAEIENVRAAWEWAVEHERVDQVDRALDALACFYTWRCYWHEGEAATRFAAGRLACPEIASGEDVSEEQRGKLRLWARLLAWQGHHTFWVEGADLALPLLQQSLALLEGPALAGQDTRRERAFVLRELGYIASEAEKSRQWFEQSLALDEAIGDRWAMGIVLNDLGESTMFAGVFDDARQQCERGLALQQAVGDYGGIPYSLIQLGVIAMEQGRLEEAERLTREALSMQRETGSQADIELALVNLGNALIYLGRFAETRPLHEESMAFFDERSLPLQSAWVRTLMSAAELHLGEYERAQSLAQDGLALARRYDYQFQVGRLVFVLGLAALAQGAYAEAYRHLQESVSIFREIANRRDLDKSLAILGYASRGSGQQEQARQHLSMALQRGVEIGAFVPLMYALPLAALLLADAGQAERAVELYALASRYGFVANSRWFEDVAGQHIAAVAEALPAEAIAAAQERGRARDLRATAAELLAEMAGS